MTTPKLNLKPLPTPRATNPPPSPAAPSIGKAFLTLGEAADYVNCSSKTIRRAVKANALPHHRFGMSETRGKIHVRATDLEKWVGSCRKGASS